MRALVTGATGLLGRALVGQLRESGVTVRALVRRGRAASAEADETHEGDLARPDSLAGAADGVDWVFHAGARVSTSGTWEEFAAVNVAGTEALIRWAVGAGVRRFVHVSSLSVYAVPNDGAVITEESAYDDDTAGRGFYARSKLMADRVAMDAARAGAPVVVVRPGLLYGPGRRPPLARRAIAVGPVRLVMARPDYLLPLAYVENVADALRRAAEAPEAVGRAYTIVDQHVRQREFFELYRRASGQRWRGVCLPVGPLLAAASVLELVAGVLGRRPPLTRHQVERTVNSATFSAARAERELDWRPRVALEEALARTFAGAQ